MSIKLFFNLSLLIEKSSNIFNNIDIEAIKPMDYLWIDEKFGSCPEEDLMYWLCRFIIDTCNNLSFRITGKLYM